MPKLEDTRKTLKLPLKSIPESEVVVRDGLLAGDFEYVYAKDISEVEMVLRVFSRMIESWNLTDDKGEVLPITIDNVKRLDINDIIDVINQTSFSKKGEGIDKKK